MELVVGNPATGFGYLARSQSSFVEITTPGKDDFAFGVQTIIDASTECRTPPGTKEIRYTWQHEYADQCGRLPLWYVKEMLGGQRQQIEMRLTDEPGASLVSLAELAAALRKGKCNSLDFNRLNQVAEMLLGLVRTMTQFKLSLGLIDPGNVFFIPETDENAALPIRTLVLADLFLLPRREDAPAWIVHRDNYEFIWHPEYESPQGDPVEQRRRYLSNQSREETYDAGREVRCVVRMLAWVLTGKALSTIPADPRLTAPVWDAFRRLLNEYEGTAESMATEIQEYKLSEHFDDRVRRRGRSRARGIPGLGLAVGVLFFLAAVTAFLRWGPARFFSPPTGKPYFVCRDCPLNSKLHQHFREHQLPLIAEFRKTYRYADDSDVWESATPLAINPLLLDLDILSAQTANLNAQLKVIDAAFDLAKSDQEFACIANELQRINSAFRDHVMVVDEASNSMGAVQDLKVIVGQMKEIGQRIDHAMSRKEIGIPTDSKIVQALESDPELEEEFSALFPVAGRLGSIEVARMYVVTIRSLGPN